MSSKLAAMRFLDTTWIDDEALGRILYHTGLGLKDGFEPLFLKRFLNELICQSIGIQLDALRGKEKWQQAAKHLDAVVRYQELAERWAQGGQILPRIPPTTLNSIITHRDHVRRELANAAKRFRKRKEAWQKYFFPRILGLYAVAFDRLPRANPPRVIDSRWKKEARVTKADPAVIFVAAVLGEVVHKQEDLGYGEAFESAGLGDPSWTNMEPESVASRMTEHMRARSSDSPEDALWQGARDEYLMRFKMLKEKE
jgi:hypothetical protein